MRDDIGLEPENGAGDGAYGAGDDRPVERDGALDAMREMPVGTNDPNIVGDVGPTDVPPGTDPERQGALDLGTTEGEAGGRP